MEKYLLWGLILREDQENLPLMQFNGDKCRFTLISMNNAMIKDVDGKLQKDEDGTTTIAYIDVIKAKNTVENLREQISKRQIERIQWLTKSQPS